MHILLICSNFIPGWRRITDNFNEFYMTDEFLETSVRVLLEILRDDYLNVTKEIQVFNGKLCPASYFIYLSRLRTHLFDVM